jgi:hypothetical protein
MVADEAHTEPSPHRQIKAGTPSLEPSLPLICPLSPSHSPPEPRRRLAEEKLPPESPRSPGRSSTVKGKVTIDPAVSLCSLSGHPACRPPPGSHLFLLLNPGLQEHVGITELLSRPFTITSTPPRSPSPLHAHLRATPHLLDHSATELATADHWPPLGEPSPPKP